MKIVGLFFLLLSFTSHGRVLKTGDILLQPLSCRACTLIEGEEQTRFAHMGLVIEKHQKLFIFEAWSKVELTPLADFLKRTKPGSKLLLITIKKENLALTQKQFAREVLSRMELFLDAKYDSEFLWDNKDETGHEKYYCSEAITKLLAPLVNRPMPLKKMHYDYLPEEWEKYFNGQPPAGKLGNSPADFERSDVFEHISELSLSNYKINHLHRLQAKF